jgi:predicted ArsR family transcriptional regulator
LEQKTAFFHEGFPVYDSDSAILGLLREHQSLTINEMIEKLGVTATAVRQKLDRLIGGGLISRRLPSNGDGQNHSRGRPCFHYELTDAGRRQLANNLSDLAGVLWEEVRLINDPAVRAAVLNGVMRRLAQQYSDRIRGTTFEERLASLAELFAQRQIPVRVEHQNGLPVLNIHGCPYPDLAQHDRTICEMETALFSRLAGQPMKLGRCQDHGCCSFQIEAGHELADASSH